MQTYELQKNLRKKFRFQVMIDGLEAGLAFGFKVPDVEWDVTEYGGAGTYFNSKEAGRMRVGPATLKKVVKGEATDDWAYNELLKPLTQPPTKYQSKDITIAETKADGSYKRQWTLHNPWVQKVEHEDYDGHVSDNMVETVTIQCDYITLENIG